MITDLNIENLLICPNDEFNGGVHYQVLYASPTAFEKLDISEDNRNISKDKVSLKPGEEFKKMDCYVEQNALIEKIAGSVKKWKTTSEFSCGVLGFTIKTLGLVSEIMNKGLVLFIRDANDKVWIMGTLQNPTYLTSGEATTGKKIEDDALVNMSFTANTRLYQYLEN